MEQLVLSHAAARMKDLFSGYSPKIGRTDHIENNGEGTKTSSKSWTENGPVSIDHWERHLRGIGPGLGIIPLREDNTVLWATIDVDMYALDHRDLSARIEDMACPLVHFRSKSGGAHLTAFFDAPFNAAQAQEFMEFWAHKLGFDGSEIFPKQNIRRSPSEIGNWLNMPYFRGMEGGRYAITKGKSLTLEQFLEGV